MTDLFLAFGLIWLVQIADYVFTARRWRAEDRKVTRWTIDFALGRTTP